METPDIVGDTSKYLIGTILTGKYVTNAPKFYVIVGDNIKNVNIKR